MFLGRRFPGTLAQLPLHESVLSYNCRSDFPALIADRWDFHLEQHGLTPIRALAHRVTLLTRLDLRPILPTISTDVLLVHGREDRVVPPAHLEALRAGLPRVETAVMPTVGHIPHMSHVEGFARLIGDWLLPCARRVARTTEPKRPRGATRRVRPVPARAPTRPALVPMAVTDYNKPCIA